MKHLPARQNTQVILRKAQNLIGVTDRILADRETTRLAVSDDGWMQRLWDWADTNEIPDITRDFYVEGLGIIEEIGARPELPRNQQTLLDLKELWLIQLFLRELPPEIGQLAGLRDVYLGGNELGELPPEIGKLINLERLLVPHNKLTVLPSKIGQLVS